MTAGLSGQLGRELRRAARTTLHHPQRGALIVAVLGLSLATNAVMVGVIDRLFFAEPPLVRQPEQIVRVVQRVVLPAGDHVLRDRLPYPEYARVAARFPALTAIGGAFRTSVSVGEGSAAFRTVGAYVTSSYFSLLGVMPRLGRVFTPAEDEPPVGAQVVVLGHEFWLRTFGGRLDAIGRRLRIDDGTFVVIGVLPPGFHGTDSQAIDLWMPLSIGGARLYGSTWDFNANAFWIETLGRLRPGMPPQALVAHAGTTGEARAPRYELTPLNRARGADRPMEARVAIWLAGVALAVLLIACANIGNLYLVRGMERRSELAIRLALGGSRAHLRVTILSEAVVLTAAGGAVGALIAVWAARAVSAQLLGAAGDTVLDLPVLMGMLALTLLVALVTALIPLAHLSERNIDAAMRAAARATDRSARVGRLALLALQVALTTVLLTGAALFLESFRAVTRINTGFEPERVIVADLDPHGSQPAAVLEQRYGEVQRALAGAPGVDATAIGVSAPFLSGLAVRVEIPGRDSLPPDTGGAIYVNAITPDFFRTLGLRLVAGRFFTNADPREAKLAVISRHFAETVWPGEEAVGRCLHIYTRTSPCYSIVGVVADPKRDRIGEDPVSQFFVPLASAPGLARSRLLFVSTNGDPQEAISQVVRAVQHALPNAPYPQVRTLAAMTGLQRRPWALGATLFSIFAALALVIASLGLYNIVFHDVKARERELAIRITLGATGPHIAASVAARTGAAALAGLLLGLAGAAWMGTRLEPLLFHTAGIQPSISTAVAALISLTVLAAGLGPMLRALRTDPSRVLREE